LAKGQISNIKIQIANNPNESMNNILYQGYWFSGRIICHLQFEISPVLATGTSIASLWYCILPVLFV